MTTYMLLALSFIAGGTALRLSVSTSPSRVPSSSAASAQIHRPVKLPVWPVAAGVVAQVFDWLGQPKLSEAVVANIGGRVVPITLSELNVSPFLLLAHHSHSFTPFDPFRAATRLFLPEGFPAHPHSGFDTVTITMTGGLRHRDSEGIQMSYGDGDVQWMRAGRGVIHEEMWDVDAANERHQRIEIFQLWVNLPKSAKFDEPAVHHLRNRDLPECSLGHGVTLKVICGTIVGGEETVSGPGTAISRSPVNILQLRAAQGGATAVLRRADSGSDSGSNSKSDSGECSVTVYVRRGSLLVGADEVRAGDVAVYRLGRAGAGAGVPEYVEVTAGPDGLDALVLTAAPIDERVLWSGPLVQVRRACRPAWKFPPPATSRLSNLPWCRRTRKASRAARGSSTASGVGRTGTTPCRTTSGGPTAPSCASRTASSRQTERPGRAAAAADDRNPFSSVSSVRFHTIFSNISRKDFARATPPPV